MASIFTKIFNRELPAHWIFEDTDLGIFLSKDQIQLGHSLIVPRQEIDHWFDLDVRILSRIWELAQDLAKIQREVYGCPRVITSFVGFEVRHVHLHVIPAWSMEDTRFSNARVFPSDRMEEEAIRLSASLKERLKSGSSERH